MKREETPMTVEWIRRLRTEHARASAGKSLEEISREGRKIAERLAADWGLQVGSPEKTKGLPN